MKLKHKTRKKLCVVFSTILFFSSSFSVFIKVPHQQVFIIKMIDKIDPELQVVKYQEPIIFEDELIPSTRNYIIEEEQIEEVVEEITYSNEDLTYLATLIYYEAGSDWIEDRHQQLVAQVCLNRVNSDIYPDTVYDVICQPGQYNSWYCNGDHSHLYEKEAYQRCILNAIEALSNNVDCPINVVYQANFKQGDGVYEEYDTGNRTTYFCYSNKISTEEDE